MIDQIENLAIRARAFVRKKQLSGYHEKIQRLSRQITDKIREGLLRPAEFIVGVFSDFERPAFDANSLRQNLVHVYQSVFTKIG